MLADIQTGLSFLKQMFMSCLQCLSHATGYFQWGGGRRGGQGGQGTPTDMSQNDPPDTLIILRLATPYPTPTLAEHL